jgi:type I restriction enzyme S subunit
MNKKEIRSFGQAFNGKTPSKDEQRSDGLPILKIRDIDENGQFRGTFGSFVDQAFYEKHKNKRLRTGDTIVLNAAHNTDYVGSKSAFVPSTLNGVIATGEWLIVRVEDASPAYVNQFLKAPSGRACLKNCVKGIHLYPKDVERIEIPLPPLDDQIRIAHLLGKVEGLIAQRKQHLQQLDDLLKSVFLEMFGDPVRNEKGWTPAPLEQLGSINRGVSKHRPRNDPKLLGGPHPLIQTGEVSNAGTYITTYTQTYSDLGFAQSKLWPAGTLCITIAANIAKAGILTFEACFPDSVVGFLAHEGEANTLYVLGLFWFFQAILEKNAPAAAQKNINLEILRSLSVPKPPIKLQGEFATIVEKVEALKSRYQQSLSDFEALYGALSQQAFKGELDLSRVALPAAPIEGESPVAAGVPAPIATPVIELPETDLLLPAMHVLNET